MYISRTNMQKFTAEKYYTGPVMLSPKHCQSKTTHKIQFLKIWKFKGFHYIA